MNADEVIRELGMSPLGIEGGFCTELYKSSRHIPDGRACGSSIYYLLRGCDRSKWHKLKSDEMWYYHAGSPALQLIIFPDGTLKKVVIGCDIANGESPQMLVPADCWQTAITIQRRDSDWGLYGTAVFPGFEYSDFIGAEDAEILNAFPHLEDEITEFILS